MIEFRFDDAAIALEMRKVERRGGSVDDMRHASLAEIERQLREAGAPDAPLEEQFRTMLASHLAMQQAGEEMLSVDAVAAKLREYNPASCVAAEVAVEDIFRPLVARLTQERNEALAARDVLREQRNSAQGRADGLAAILASAPKRGEVDTLRQERDEARKRNREWEDLHEKR